MQRNRFKAAGPKAVSTSKRKLTPDVSSQSQTNWFAPELESSLQFNGQNDQPSRGQHCDMQDCQDHLNREMDLTDSLKLPLKYLGLGPGIELPVGAKPISTREAIVRHVLNGREEEFTDLKSIRVFCGTWNVNNQSPNTDLGKWLVVDENAPDIYVIGFQELDLSSEAFIFKDSMKEREWQEAVRRSLHPKARYRKVKSTRLVGILLIVFINEHLTKHISYIDTDAVPTGIMGIMGNKGGVSVRFTLYSTSLCFINSHLAAHQDELERRNQDYRDIASKTRFKQFFPPLTIDEHDIVFWVGDLNYRIVKMQPEDIRNCIRNHLYPELRRHDELLKQLGCSEIFKGFTEGEITFDPTYKFDMGTDTYDTSEKRRISAWCDRILWKGNYVQQVRYSSHPKLQISDHKPVSSLFNVRVRVINDKRYKTVYDDIMKKMDNIENDFLPQIKLDKTECHFQDVKFIEPQIQTIKIDNIGLTHVEFEFIKKLDETRICKPWLQITPYKSIVNPGLSCEVQIEVYVDKSTVGFLCTGENNLEDILVLHLHGGKDFFIGVTGNYLTSSFGSSIEALIQMHKPIRAVPVDRLVDIEQPGSLDHVELALTGGRQIFMVPKELWQLIDHINVHGKDKKNLFEVPGLNEELQQIRECLDTGVPETLPGSIHSVAESLLLFLECLEEPVIPFNYYTECLAASNNLLLSKQVLSKIPVYHKNTFYYICEFLKEVLKFSDKNGLDIRKISALFGKVLLRAPQSVSHDMGTVRSHKQHLQEEEGKKAAFMYHFLTNDILG